MTAHVVMKLDDFNQARLVQFWQADVLVDSSLKCCQKHDVKRHVVLGANSVNNNVAVPECMTQLSMLLPRCSITYCMAVYPETGY